MTVRQIEGEWQTVVEVLRAAASDNADVEAYVEPATAEAPRRTLTFAQWDRAADGVAGLFAAHGAGHGSVVCLMLPSSIDYMVCYAATTRLGAIVSGINLRLGQPEVRSILDRTRPAVTVVEDGAVPPAGPTGEVLARSAVTAATAGPPPPRFPELARTDPVAVVWTSGTTGLPKGAVFDHDALAAVADGTDVLSEPGDRRLSPLPFAHVGSMTRTWDEVANAVTTVITPTPWRAADTIRVIADERITVAQGVPTQWALVLAHPDLDGVDVSSLRIAGTGASRVPPELVAAMRARSASRWSCATRRPRRRSGPGRVPGDADDVVATSVGRPVPGVELAVVDDDGVRWRPARSGRVRLRSAAVMRGYGAVPRPARERGEWSTTPRPPPVGAGRRRLADHRGLRVRRRRRQPASGRTGQRALHPGWLQRLPGRGRGGAGRPPAVAQVAVVGAPDPVLGEIGVAFVVPPRRGPGPPTARRAPRPRCRAGWPTTRPRPTLWSRLPVTPMAKMDKRALADRAARARRCGRRSECRAEPMTTQTKEHARPMSGRLPRRPHRRRDRRAHPARHDAVTLVEPHRGHEVAYNRWYERDHFYAGCLIGAYKFAGARFVATAASRRSATPTAPTPSASRPDRSAPTSAVY